MPTFQPDLDFARQRDAADPLRHCRDLFHIPSRPDGRPAVYFCGHSLGLEPKAVRAYVDQELEDWARLAVDAHFQGRSPWYSYHELFREPASRLVGARPGEVVLMNSLTINLHLMLTSFYRPSSDRFQVLMEEPTFPSDRYAVASHIQCRGVDPEQALVTIRPRPGESIIHLADFEALLEERGKQIAVVLLSGVNFITGQWFDMERITAAAHRQGCVVGWDLAHAAGNVVLQLHDWDVDFAVWCGYKYLNGGPGAVGGCFVHERHGENLALPRLAGWWGNDPATRFRMHLQPEFVPVRGAEGWQVSNPPILAMAPLRAALAIFDGVGMAAIRRKSEALTGYLIDLLDRLPAGQLEVITPRNPAQRGAQLSLLVHDQPHDVMQRLQTEGIVCDFREPNVLRVAAAPLYNTFEEVWRFAQVLLVRG